MRYIISIILFNVALSVVAQTTIDRAKHYNLENGLAIQGYDPVSYFSHKVLKGTKTYAAKYLGTVYYFASETNKSIFVKNPSKYEPQYGGWCAFAMGNTGEKVEIDPNTFKIIDGKLYLFYNAYFNNTLITWNKNEKILKAKADKNWTTLTKK